MRNLIWVGWALAFLAAILLTVILFVGVPPEGQRWLVLANGAAVGSWLAVSLVIAMRFRVRKRLALLASAHPGAMVLAAHRTANLTPALGRLDGTHPRATRDTPRSYFVVADDVGVQFRRRGHPLAWREFPWRQVEAISIGSDSQNQGTYPTITLAVTGLHGVTVALDFLVLSLGKGWFYLRDRRELTAIVEGLETRRQRALARGR